MINRIQHYRHDIFYDPIEDYKYTPEMIEEHSDNFVLYFHGGSCVIDVHDDQDVVVGFQFDGNHRKMWLTECVLGQLLDKLPRFLERINENRVHST